jgi:hypothetical protein
MDTTTLIVAIMFAVCAFAVIWLVELALLVLAPLRKRKPESGLAIPHFSQTASRFTTSLLIHAAMLAAPTNRIAHCNKSNGIAMLAHGPTFAH